MKPLKSSRWISCVLAALAVAFTTIEPAHAARINVTANATDTLDGMNGQCSLREAIANINNRSTLFADCAPIGSYGTGDTINIPAGTYTTAIAGANEDLNASGDFDLNQNVAIAGAGAGVTTIDGGALDRVFHITGMYTVSISGIRIRNGTSPAGTHGGAIYNSGTLSIASATFSNNTAAGDGGGIFNNGTLTVTKSLFSGNSADNGGGISHQTGTASISYSTFSNNSASNGGGVFITGSGTIAVLNSTLTGNSANNDGGAFYNLAGTLTLTNATLSGNAAGNDGGGIVNFDNGGTGPATLTVANSTITASTRTGLWNRAGTATLSNTIVAKQAASSADCAGAITSSGHNLESAATCGFTGSGDLQNSNPLLGALSDHGGPTLVMALLSGSPAINAGACAQAVDQRGIVRPQDYACDIGAYERVIPSSVITFTPTLVSGYNLLGNSLNTTLDVVAVFGNQTNPVAITSSIESVWKWNTVTGKWQFHSPLLSPVDNAAFAASHNHEVLTGISAGEGYWVNALSAVDLPSQSGSAFNWNSFSFAGLQSEFNLLAHAGNISPSEFNTSIGVTPPGVGGVVATGNFDSLWVWDAANRAWFFYSPLLESSGGLAAVKTYADSRSFRHFEDFNKQIGVGAGFWVQKNADRAPDAFSFAPVQAPAGTAVTSTPVVIAGLDVEAPVLISGATLIVNGIVYSGPFGDFVAPPGPPPGPAPAAPRGIRNGDQIALQVNAPSTPGASASATITIGGVSATYTVTAAPAGPADTQAPSIPGGLTATAASASAVNLVWTSSTDNVAVTAYKVYRGGVLIATLGNVTSHGDTGLAASTGYSYTIKACDAASNCSEQSGASTATTPASGSSTYTAELVAGFNMLGNALNISLDVMTVFGNLSNPVVDISENIATVWKWDAVNRKWQFHSPLKSTADNAAYANAQGFDVLTTIAAGEGYWVNALADMTLSPQTGTAFTWNGFNFAGLPTGFNLIAHGVTVKPYEFNGVVSEPPPDTGVVPTGNFFTLWAWNTTARKWYFYSPLKESEGGLSAVKAYADSQYYLDFEELNKTLGLGVGFWVNKAPPQ